MKTEKIGELAFIACVVIAIIAGIAAPSNGTALALLVVLGIIVGFVNITEKEVTSFLIAAIALLVAGTVGLSLIPVVGSMLDNILDYIGAFVAPAAIIVSLKAIYSLASGK
ncbi:MAG: hypothetical protein QXQ40_02520 [Candidatus Aenigmatarchaeota archaeon]